MTIRLEFDRIPPGAEIGPHRHGVETIVYLAAGALIFEHGEELDRHVVVGSGDVLYEAPAELHLVRNEGAVDALALLASVDPEPSEPGRLLRRWEGGDEPVRRGRDADLVTDRDGAIARRRIVRPGDFGMATFTVTEVTIAPGAADEWHRHPGAEHALVVFEGRGLVTVDDAEEVLEPLTGIRVEPGLVHRVENTGRQLLRYYVCASPGTDPVIDRQPARRPSRRLDA